MAAIIQNLIPLQNFELIRDRIGSILFDEVKNQSILDSNNPDLDATIYSERIIPYSVSETPAINVSFSGGNYSVQTQIHTDGVYKYFIDVYTSANTEGAERGDKLSLQKLHRLLGICRAILENPQYKTLLFPAPSIERINVSSIDIAEPENKQDSTSSVFGRLTLEVRIPEYVQLLIPNQIDGSDTGVKIELTDEGYVYTNDY